MDTHIDYNIALGFSRLSLIDLEHGMQPLSNEDGSLILICNGEIYNYKELRNSMEQRGHRFRTKTDVEVILHLYEEYQTRLLNRLNGQFAFVIYYKKKGDIHDLRNYKNTENFVKAEGLPGGLCKSGRGEERGEHMFCTDCGKQLEDGAKFCIYCGAVQDGAGNAGAEPAASRKGP